MKHTIFNARCICLAAACLFSTVSAFSIITRGKCGDNVSYEYDTSTGYLTITGTGPMHDYDGNTSLDDHSPWGSLQNVVIGEGVTTVGDWAFAMSSVYNNVVHFTLPSTLTRIGSHAFQYIPAGSSITIPASVSEIRTAAFCGGYRSAVSIDPANSYYTIESGALYDKAKTRLLSYLRTADETSFTVPSTVTAIDDYGFCYATSLQSVTLPEGLTSIGAWAMSWMRNLKSLTMPSTLRSIGDDCFYMCTGMTSVTLNNGLQSIGDEAFYSCYTITSMSIPSSVTYIGNRCFYYCTSIENAVLTSVTGQSMFERNTDLKNVDFGNVTEISLDCFSGCTSLETIALPDKLTIIGARAFNGCTALKTANLPSSLRSIGQMAFSGCSSLTGVTLPDALTSLGTNAFSGCSKLEEAVIPASLRSIGADIFSECPLMSRIMWNPRNASDAEKDMGPFHSIAGQITSFTFGSEVEHVPAWLMQGMTQMTAVTFPASVQTIGDGVCHSCSGLQTVTMSDGVTSLGNNAFYNCNALQSIRLSDKITGIDSNAFANCTNLTDINVPSALKQVGERAFEKCSKMTSFSLPDGVTDIGDYAFLNCTALTNYRMPLSLVNLGRSAFSGCGAVDSLYIPSGVTCLPRRVFDESRQLRKLTFAPDSKLKYIGDFALWFCENLQEIRLPETVDSIGAGAFAGCSSIKEITIPEAVRTIDIWGYMNSASLFNSCTALGKVTWLPVTCNDFLDNLNITPFYEFNSWGEDDLILIDTIVFGDKVEHIPGKLCYKMSDLKEITLPASLKTVGEEAFSGCTGINAITIYAPVPPAVNANIFEGIDRPSTALWVPYDNVLAYRTAEVWKDFDIQMLPQAEYTGKCGENAFWTYTVATRTLRIHGTGAMTYNSEYEVFAPDVDTLVIDNGITEIAQTGEYGDTFGNLKSLKAVKWNVKNMRGISWFSSDNELRKNITYLEFGSEVELIPDYICMNMGVRNIIVPEGVKEIGEVAFSYCESLEHVTLPSTLLAIGNYAFLSDASLQEIVLPDGLTSIGDDAFGNCRSLTSLILPATLQTIGSSAFSGCESLTEVVISEGVTSLAIQMFSSCYSLKSLVIPEGISVLPSHIFTDCISLETIELPSTLTKIENYAFMCWRAESSLAHITCHALTPPELDDNYKPFKTYDAQLTVHCSCEQLYREHAQWSKFAFAECIEDETAVDDLSGDFGITVADGVIHNADHREISVYNLMGQQLYSGSDEHIRLSGTGLFIITVADTAIMHYGL